jgi:hypothetical protein
MEIDGHLPECGRAVRISQIAPSSFDHVSDERVVMAHEIAAQRIETLAERRAQAIDRIDRG